MPRPTTSPVADGKPPLFTAAGRVFERLLGRGAGHIGVAVSGGGDSMALLAMLQRWAAPRALQIHAATVDHGLRPEARAEADMVADWCAGQGIPHTILTVTGLGGPGNLQAKAREARYAALADWSIGVHRQAGSQADINVLTGHTMDDQAETVLMRLARGSGAEGLSGMADGLDWKGVLWRRPFLTFRRSDLRQWLRSEGVPWVEDPSNEDPTFDRIKARRALEVLEPLGITVEGLAATADRLRRQCELLDAETQRVEQAALKDREGREAVIDRRALRASHSDSGMRVLAQTLQRIGGGAYRPRFRSVEPLYQRIIANGCFRATLGKCLIEADDDRITIRPEHTPDGG